MFFFKTIFNRNAIQFFFFYSSFVTWKPKHHNLFGVNSQFEAANPFYSEISHTLTVDKYQFDVNETEIMSVEIVLVLFLTDFTQVFSH